MEEHWAAKGIWFLTLSSSPYLSASQLFSLWLSSVYCLSFFVSSLLPAAYFTELHGNSERSLLETLSPLGPLYSQNTRLYGDLYADLRQYYRGSALNLDETLSEFWSRLLERTFKISTPSEVSTEVQRTVKQKSLGLSAAFVFWMHNNNTRFVILSLNNCMWFWAFASPLHLYS